MSDRLQTNERPRPKTAEAALRSLKERVNDVLEEFWEKVGTRHPAVSGRALGGVVAETDLSRSAESLHIEMELPGMEIDDIEILVQDRDLTVRGEKRIQRDIEGRTFYAHERAFGEFARTFRLPEGARPENAKARYRNGVLEIEVPREPAPAGATRKIRIRSA